MLMPEHIAGADNCTADHLSRNNMHTFFSINSQASTTPTPVSPLLQELLTPPRTRLDIKDLQAAVSFYYQRGLANSTQKLYHIGQKRYIHFCTQHKLTALPATEFTMLSFSAYLAKQNITYSTIKVYISAIRNLHVASGQHHHFTDQLTPRLEQVLRGIKKGAIL